MSELVVVGAKSGSVAEAESSLLEGEWESGSRSDGLALGGGGAATPSYLDGHFTGQEDNHAPWPANKRVEEGRAKFQNLMLAPPPSNFVPFQLDDMDKEPNQWTYKDENGIKHLVSVWKNRKRPMPSKGTDKQLLTQDSNQDRRPSVGLCLTSNSKKTALEGSTVRPGEYVIMIKDVTSPPFLGQALPAAFAFLRVLPAKKNKSQTDDTEKTKEDH